MKTLFDFNPKEPEIEGWAENETSAKKKANHFIRDGRRACNGMRDHSPVIDRQINRPGGCVVCKTVLGLCSPWYKGYADPKRRGA